MAPRWKAAGTHLLLSFLVIGTIAAVAFSLWYPDGLWRIAGLNRLLVVMLIIDVTAGPVLTAIIYKPGKRGLKFDLVVIGILQLAFLGYGLHTLWQSRPVFLVATAEVITVVFAGEIDDEGLAKGSAPEHRRRSLTGPVLVGTRMPEDPDARRVAMQEFMAGGAGIERSPKYYLPFEQIAPALLQGASPVEGVDAISDAAVEATGRTRQQLRHAPIGSTRGYGTVLLDAATGQPRATLATDP